MGALALVVGAGCAAHLPHPAATVQPAGAVTTGATASDVVYASPGGVPLHLDAYLPDQESGPVPAVLVVHGGSFIRGTKDDASIASIARDLAASGYAAFSIQYRLAPAYPYPAANEDVAAAVRWLRDPARVQQYHLDPRRIGIVGASAGGTLASYLGVDGSGPLDRGSRVAAVVSLSAGESLVPGSVPGEDYLQAVTGAIGYLGCRPGRLSPAACPNEIAASPITHVDSSDAPFYLLASRDEFVPPQQSEAMAAALRAAGVPAQLRVLPGRHHAADLVTPDVMAGIVAFLDAHVRR